MCDQNCRWLWILYFYTTYNLRPVCFIIIPNQYIIASHLYQIVNYTKNTIYYHFDSDKTIRLVHIVIVITQVGTSFYDFLSAMFYTQTIPISFFDKVTLFIVLTFSFTSTYFFFDIHAHNILAFCVSSKYNRPSCFENTIKKKKT